MTTFIQLPVGGGGADFISSILDGDAIDLEVLANQLTAELFHSATAAGANQVKITNTTETDGLLSVLPYADTNSIDFTGSTSLSANLRLSGTAAGANQIKITNSVDAGGLLSLVDLVDTNAISLADNSGIEATLLLSAAAAPASNFKATTTIESDGLLVVIPEAGAAQTGVITSASWNKFNDGVTAITDGSSVGAGQIGETTSDQSGLGSHGAATGVFESVLSRNLTAGIWRIDANVLAATGSANLTGPIEAAISDSATGVGLNDYEKTIDPSVTSLSTYNRGFTVPPKIVNITSTTTYHLVVKFNFDSGTPQRGGQIRAERIR